ncbi:hypothetical protein EKO27_g1213 [Xylaria grammica]|uniref:Amidase domain-containing protein n=1 Tax=Xylaria grammica TaxID=363999 RepID=A0A439DHQ2_9PEZI|nr:hypothetical protein EKO27_g1213 [Xylaria grammica]
MEPHRLTATQALSSIKDGSLTVEQYAQSLVSHIQKRDPTVQAWEYFDSEHVLQEAKRLDGVPLQERGELHGLPIAVKDIIYTKGKTTTTEFASTQGGPKTHNPHDPKRTPGGSSSGSAAAVADFQAPIGLGSQTGGSTIRPGSFNGIYSFKPTWNAISREGQKIYSATLDTIGFFARCVEDLELMANLFGLEDDDTPGDGFTVKGAKFAIVKTVVWPEAGPGTKLALETATRLLRNHGAEVEEIDLPAEFDRGPEWHRALLYGEGRVTFLPEHRLAKEKLSPFLAGHVENVNGISRAAQLEAYDGIAALRPKIDKIAKEYAAILTPSVIDEAPVGLESTGSPAFNVMWTALHTPVVNIPGFRGANDMPIGLSLIAPRYQDRRLLMVSKAVGAIFEPEGGWNVPKYVEMLKLNCERKWTSSKLRFLTESWTMAAAHEVTTMLEVDEKDIEIIAMRPQKPIKIVEYRPEWPAMFAEVEKRIRQALGDRAVTIQHVGSTSVPGLAAKDVIDVDLAVADPADEESYVPGLQAAGFVFLFREPTWYQHRFFHLEEPYTNLHVFGSDSSEMVRHRLFRDWLREHEDDRERYAAVKREAAEAAAAAGENVQQYNNRKESGLRDILQRIFEAHGFSNPSA